MKILCIIPAYNAAEFIVASIKSILRQSFKTIDIVVVDDCSTDSTYQLAASTGVRVLRNPVNLGPYLCLNNVLSQAVGYDAWYFHGADDISFENHFHHLSLPLINNDKLLMSFCNYNRVDYNTGKTSHFIGTGSSMCLYRFNVFNTIGPYDDTRFGGDTEYWRRLLLFFPSSFIFHVNQTLANCFVHKTNLTSIFSREQRIKYVDEFSLRHKLLSPFSL